MKRVIGASDGGRRRASRARGPMDQATDTWSGQMWPMAVPRMSAQPRSCRPIR